MLRFQQAIRNCIPATVRNCIPTRFKDAFYRRFYAFRGYCISLKIFFARFFANLYPALIVLLVRAVSPLLIIRFGIIRSDAIGHFALNTELYLCKRDLVMRSSKKPSIDLWFYWGEPRTFICNKQLDRMWRRKLWILPRSLLMPPWRLLGKSQVHLTATISDSHRDVDNLLDKSEPHLSFLPSEEVRGQHSLRVMGVPADAPFVCLIVRDSAYLKGAYQVSEQHFAYHNYRDCDVDNFVLAAEALASRNYYVIRMSAIAQKPFSIQHPKVIDYATNGMRSDFMDIYLGAKCAFCISTGTGFDSVPSIFRRPVVFTNLVPLGMCHTFSCKDITIFKKHWDQRENRSLRLREILERKLDLCRRSDEYEEQDVQLIENTPQEIRAVVMEMADRLEGSWQPEPQDSDLQQKFWEIFPKDTVWSGLPLHGEIRSRIGSEFLRQDPSWLS